jgi:hypothetical protein
MMQLHLDEISRNVAEDAHAVLLLDRAGWHTTNKVDVPDNMTPIFLPSRAPELNPVENVWQYLRQNWLSNTVFENYDAIVDAACAVWRKLIAQPKTITSIGMRDWAHVDQPLRPLVINASRWIVVGDAASAIRWVVGRQTTGTASRCTRVPTKRALTKVRTGYVGSKDVRLCEELVVIQNQDLSRQSSLIQRQFSST